MKDRHIPALIVIVLMLVFLGYFIDKATANTTCGVSTGGISTVKHGCTSKGKKAKIKKNGDATIPAGAPKKVQKVIKAANRINHKPYIYGGGHGSFRAAGYDCSGAVSYALKGGKFLRTPLASGPFMNWGKNGRGKWITVYTNPGHAYVVVAGLRFDTSGPGASGPRWRASKSSMRGLIARHPARY